MGARNRLIVVDILDFVGMRKTVLGILIVVAMLCFFARCATVSTPQGGPRDSIPPVFRSSVPEAYSANFKGKKLTLTFDENVLLKEQQKYFFMSPPKSKKPSLLAKGKSIVVEFEEPLDSATTYSLDFGAAITDATEGNKVAAFNFVFSTGDHVDSLVMNGQAIDAYSRDSVIGAFMFFFDASLYDSTKLDSLMWNGQADAMFRTDSSGFFLADILRDKEYRIYAMYDKNGNQLYEAGTDYIGFTDKSFNPTKLGGFTMVYDSLTRRWDIDTVQSYFEMFLEQPKKKQLLLGNKRPKQNLIVLSFNEKNAIIDTLDIEGVPESWQIRSWSRNHDTLSVWINPPTAEQRNALPDTLKARLVYERTDSVWNMYPYGQNLNLRWKPYVAKQQKQTKPNEKLTLRQQIKKLFSKKHRRTKRIAADSTLLARFIADSIARDSIRQKEVEDSIKKATQIKISVNATENFVPLTDLIFTFEAPLDSLKTEGIQMWRLPQVIKKGKVVEEKRTAREAGSPVPFEVFKDSIDILKVHIKADWHAGDKFSLVIPENAFHTILGEKNDTLKSDFVVASPNKYGTVILKSISKSENIRPETRYIYQIIEKVQSKESFSEARVIQQISGVMPGEEVKIEYITPGEKYQLRIIEDTNGNGWWDTGVLETHTMPEKVRILTQKNSNNPILVVKENWTIEFEVDYKNLFK